MEKKLIGMIMNIQVFFLAVTAIFILFSQNASATTVTFEEIINPSVEGQIEYPFGEKLISSGMAFWTAPGTNNIHVNSATWADNRAYLGFPNNGTNYLTSYSDNNLGLTSTVMYLSSEYIFSMTSVDASMFSYYSTTNTLTFYGHQNNGATIEQTFMLQSDMFQTFLFNDSWNNLQYIEIAANFPYPIPGGNYHGRIFNLDNLVYTNSATPNSYTGPETGDGSNAAAPVPEPATIVLFCTGVVILSGARFGRNKPC